MQLFHRYKLGHIASIAQIRPIATDVTRSVVCLFVCGSHWMCHAETAEPIEMRFWEAVTRVSPRNHVLDGGRDPRTERGNFGELSGPLKALKVSAAVFAAKERDHSILNNGMTARLLQPTAMLPTGQCNINCPTEKNPPMRCGLSSKIFDHLFGFRVHINKVLLSRTELIIKP